MESDLWRRVSDLFDAALDRPPEERRSFVERACQGDAALLAEVSRLLAEFAKAGSFLEDSMFQLRQTFETGEMVSGRYRIEALIGRGGMGEVYRAHDALIDEPVALKTLRTDRAGDPDFLKHFRQEIQLARKVTHPSVCRIFDLGVHDEGGPRPVHYFSMQLLEGESLAARLHREGRLSTEAALPIARQVAEALDAIHEAHITHGDLKSGNVMFHGGRAVITDFGLARFSPAAGPLPLHTSLAAGLSLAGTIAYMSPEQLEGQPPTNASDVYSFGVLLFEMLVGKPPFNDSHLLRSAMQRVTSAAPDIRGMAPEIERSWAEVITRCLRRDPGRRFTHARDAVARLRPGARVVLPNWSRRQWLIAAGTSAAAIAGVALIPAGLRLYPQAPALPEGAGIVLGTIANLTKDEQLDAVTELFRIQLGQSARVNLFEAGRLTPVLRQMGVANEASIEPTVLREAAWRVNAVATVFGTIARVGADYVLNVQVETRGSQPDRPRQRVLRTFPAADPRALMYSVHEAARWVREVAGETAASLAAADLLPEDATTPSWKALARYAAGQQLFLAQKFDPAIDQFTEALEEDPKFTLAALRRSDLLVSQNRQVEGFRSYRNALALLKERSVTRPEELYGRGMFALDSGDFESADRYFRTWASEYPYDWRAPFYRMLPLCMNGYPEQAVDLLDRLKTTIPDYGDLYCQIIRALIMVGRTDDARALLPTVRRLNWPERADLHEAYICFREADTVACLEVLRKVQKSGYRRGATDAMMQEGLLLIDAGYPDVAAKNIGAFLDAGSWVETRPYQTALLAIKAWAEMLSGRKAVAIENAQHAVKDEAAPIIVAVTGTVFARSGAPGLARGAMNAMRTFEDIHVFRIARHRIAGELARRDGDSATALAELGSASALEPAIAHRQYLIEALPAGSPQRVDLARQALRYPWQSLRPPLMHHIGAVGLAVAEVRAAGVSNPFADRFAASAKDLHSKL